MLCFCPVGYDSSCQRLIDLAVQTRQLAKFQKSKGEVIIAGDYNIDLLKINNKPNITEYLDSVLEHSFFPKITFLLDSLSTEVH